MVELKKKLILKEITIRIKKREKERERERERERDRQTETDRQRERKIKNESSKDCTWSAVPDALLGVISCRS